MLELAVLIGSVIWFVVAEPETVNQFPGAVRLTEFDSSRQPR